MLDYFINKTITITIIIFFLWVFMLFSILIYNLTHYLGILKTEQHAHINPDDNIIASYIFICRFLVYPIFIYLCIVTVVLSFIFWIWLVIIYFVPFLVFIGFIPIPIKIPILEFVPPFKVLTDRGILPLIRRINARLIEFIFTLNPNIHNENINDLYSYIYDEIKKIIKGFFSGLIKVVRFDFDFEISKPVPAKPINVELEKDVERDKLEKESKKIQETIDNDKDNIKKLINEEIQICIANKSKGITSDLTSSESFFQAQTNRSNYADCYAKTMNLYINNLL